MPRPVFVTAPRSPRFGRRIVPTGEAVAPRVGDDLRLFATTFAAGFLFVAIFLA